MVIQRLFSGLNCHITRGVFCSHRECFRDLIVTLHVVSFAHSSPDINHLTLPLLLSIVVVCVATPQKHSLASGAAQRRQTSVAVEPFLNFQFGLRCSLDFSLRLALRS